MFYPGQLTYPIETYVDLYEVERRVKEAFEEVFGEGAVLDIFAGEYPARIGVILFLKGYDKAKALATARRAQKELAAEGLRVGILALPASAMKGSSEGRTKGD